MTKIIDINPENPNGIERDMTAEEQAQHDIDVANVPTEKANITADKENTANLKASAKAKLIAGEALTEDEANTIVL